MSVEETTSERDFPKVQIAVVGVGGAGNNLLSHAISRGINPNNCVAVSRSLNQLSGSQAKNKVLLAESVPRASTDWPNSSQLLAHRVSPFTDEAELTLLLAGLGGVTGTSAAPTIAQLNRTGLRTVVSIVALPFIHERHRRFVALRGLKRMVESCDCTVTIDNASQSAAASGSERGADETVASVVQCLSEAITEGGPQVARRILRILSLGQIATVCRARPNSSIGIQTAIVDALRRPSASLPISIAKGAVMVFRGPVKLSSGEAVRAYDTIASLVGHNVNFVHFSVEADSSPLLLVFLTGYSYGNALAGFVDLIEGLYDLEFGASSGSAELGLPLSLYQMEVY